MSFIHTEVEVEDSDTQELHKIVGPELSRFEAWFTSKGNQTLTRYERAMLVTYLGWKIHEDGVGNPDTRGVQDES